MIFIQDKIIVQRLEHAAYTAQLYELVLTLRREKSIRYETVLNTHRHIFATIYPSWAGTDRSAYPYAIGKAGYRNLFAYPNDVRRATEQAIQMASDHALLRKQPGEIFGLFAHAHPFFDGNGRTILTLYTELCRRANFMIHWPAIQKNEFLSALTAELQMPGKGSLDGLLLAHCTTGKLSVPRMVDHLQTNFERQAGDES